MTIEVTDEMRRAVFLEMCVNQGHSYSIQSMFRSQSSTDGNQTEIGSPDQDLLPHVYCTRCEKTWLVLDEPGDNYDDAETKARARMLDNDPWNKRPRRS